MEAAQACCRSGRAASCGSCGRNLPVSPDQRRNALGNEQLQQLARAAGLPVDQLLAALSQHLPDTVDRMSPNGTLEDEASTSGQGGSLQQQAGLDDIKG